MDADTAVAALGIMKIALGWPLQLAALGAHGVAARAQPHPDGARRAAVTLSDRAVAQPPWWCGERSRSSPSSTSAGTTNSSSSPASSGCSADGV